MQRWPLLVFLGGRSPFPCPPVSSRPDRREHDAYDIRLDVDLGKTHDRVFPIRAKGENDEEKVDDNGVDEVECRDPKEGR